MRCLVVLFVIAATLQCCSACGAQGGSKCKNGYHCNCLYLDGCWCEKNNATKVSKAGYLKFNPKLVLASGGSCDSDCTSSYCFCAPDGGPCECRTNKHHEEPFNTYK